MNKKAQVLTAMYNARKQGVITLQYIRVVAVLARSAVHHGVMLSVNSKRPLPPND